MNHPNQRNKAFLGGSTAAIHAVQPANFDTKEELLQLTELSEPLTGVVLRTGPFDAKPSAVIRRAKQIELESIVAKRKAPTTNPAGVAAQD